MTGFRWFSLLLLAAALLENFGCAPQVPASNAPSTKANASPQTGSSTPGEATSGLTAADILQKLLAAYRGAESYQDQAVVRLSFQQAGEVVKQEWPAAVAFERPNRLSLVAYQATVKSDGKELRALIDDSETGNVDNQVVVRPAPQVLKLADLASDELLYNTLSSQLRRQPIQLELLLESGGLVSAFSGDVACRKLPDGKHGGRECYRVEVPSPGGPFVFWIDRADFVLRRLDYPAAALVPELANDPTVSQIELLADLRGARLGAAIPADQFVLELPAAAKRMRAFARPPRPLPSQLFGKEPGSFYFYDLSGAPLEKKQFDGKVAVLAWYHEDPACQATLQQVALARQRLQGQDDVVIYAVATDPTSAGSDHLENVLTRWQVALPIVRDLEAFGDKVFKIKGHPTMVVLDPQGRVQIFQVGGSPQLADQLVQIVERLKNGDDLATEIVTRHAREREEYDQLVARGGPEPGELVELPEAVIRRASQPKLLRLKELWTCADIKSPGNILLVEEPGAAPRVFVFEGWRAIAELDATGSVIARHALDLPPQAMVTFARTATEKNGRRHFALAAPLSPQVYVFDDQWQLKLAYPPADQTPLQVMDLDLPNFGTTAQGTATQVAAELGPAGGVPEMVVANVGDLGLVALSLEGDVRWRNRAFPNVLAAAVAHPDEFGSSAIYLAGESGQILRVNKFGHEESPVTIRDWPIVRLTAARFSGAKQAEFLGLSNTPQGEPFAIGITARLEHAWNYPLPAGIHQKPIEPVTSSNLLPGRQGEWWLAGPDGSIHVISEDGEFHDSFYSGAALTGIAATQLAGQPTLLIATDSGVTAWRVE